MCDTILAAPGTTADSSMLFGKNSDRQRNEAQVVVKTPAAEHSSGDELTCTYITIPQVRHTSAVLLSRPFWTWGAEMGANEHGVVIGNEGIHARRAAPREPALIGMDLVRIGLERSSSAAEAIQVICQLLERYGQGGNCGHLVPSYYNNGFVVADSHEAFVLETIEREWLVERIEGVRSVSNRYSIGREVQGTSSGLNSLIREEMWSADPAPNYAEVVADPNREHIGNAGARRSRSTSLLRARESRLTAADMMQILRDHGTDGDLKSWRADSAERTLCMHAGGGSQIGQTVGSLVSEVHSKGAVHWVTATAAPCISIFKPVLMDTPLPIHGPTPDDRFDTGTLWWSHERLHRALLPDKLTSFIEDIAAERDALETTFQAKIAAVLVGGDSDDRAHVVADCWELALRAEERWSSRVDSGKPHWDSEYMAAWVESNRVAGMESVI